MQGAQVQSLVGKFHVPHDADNKKDKNILASVAIHTVRAETVYALITFRFPTSIKVSNTHTYHIIALYALNVHNFSCQSTFIKLRKF